MVFKSLPFSQACFLTYSPWSWLTSASTQLLHQHNKNKLECGPMPNVMAALPNIVGAVCATPQSLADNHYESRAVMLPRRETRSNLLRCPKLANRSQPLVRQSPSYCEHVGETLLFNKFFPIDDKCLIIIICEDIAWQSCAMVPRWQFLGDFFGHAFAASHMQHISDLQSKFALRPHHVWKYGRHPICDCWD